MIDWAGNWKSQEMTNSMQQIEELKMFEIALASQQSSKESEEAISRVLDLSNLLS